MKAILIVDHGSTRAEANAMLPCMAHLVQHLVGGEVAVRYAHMELAEPTIAQGFTECVEAGADEVIVFPYMLSPGKHSTRDIPRLVGEAAGPHTGVQYRVTAAFGVHEKLGELILSRAGLTVRHPVSGADAVCCWDGARSGTACGDACRLKGAESLVIS
jgi:sirohydrochlorin ferrochelatase